jgi:hypothetical protein
MQNRGRPRIDVDYPVTLSVEEGGGIGAGTMTNLTITGGEIQSQMPVSVGTCLSIHISLSGARSPIDVAVATVRWKRDDRFGVEFVRFEGKAKAQLEDMLNQTDGLSS